MMLKIPLLLLTTVLISIPCLGQSPTIQWQRCLGGNYAADKDSQLGQQWRVVSILVSTGRSTGGDLAGSGYHQWIDQWGFPSSDFWVVNSAASGSIQWQKCFGSFGNETPWDVRSTADGGYIVVGSTTSNGGNVSGYRGGESDVWLVKLSAAGTLQWQRCLGGTNSDFGYGVEQVQDGGYIVSGSTRSNDGDILGNNGNGDIWVVRLNELGIPLWQSCLGGSGAEVFARYSTNAGWWIHRCRRNWLFERRCGRLPRRRLRCVGCQARFSRRNRLAEMLGGIKQRRGIIHCIRK